MARSPRLTRSRAGTSGSSPASRSRSRTSAWRSPAGRSRSAPSCSRTSRPTTTATSCAASARPGSSSSGARLHPSSGSSRSPSRAASARRATRGTPSRTPGGSSGGSGAAVAAGMVPVAHASDGGGSIRIPASCCGLVGLKASRGRISRGPEFGDSFLATDGTLCRTVAETAATLDVIAGYEPGDATWAPPPSAPFAEAVGRDPGKLRIGFTTKPPMGADPHPESVSRAEEAAKLLESLGHEIVPMDVRLARRADHRHLRRPLGRPRVGRRRLRGHPRLSACPGEGRGALLGPVPAGSPAAEHEVPRVADAAPADLARRDRPVVGHGRAPHAGARPAPAADRRRSTPRRRTTRSPR